MKSIVEIDCLKINDWESFHDVFSEIFGFPEFYGRNMNAWIDCMSCLSAPEERMTTIHCKNESVITLNLTNMNSLKQNCPDIYEAIVECTAFVNYRLIEVGEAPVLALSYYV